MTLAAPGNDLQFLTNPEPVQLLSSEVLGALPFRQVTHAHLVGQGEERAGHLLLAGVPIRLLLGQDMPDGHQQLAGDGYQGFGPADTLLQTKIVLPPLALSPGRVLGSIDQRPAQVPPAGLGDPAGGMAWNLCLLTGPSRIAVSQMVGQRGSRDRFRFFGRGARFMADRHSIAAFRRRRRNRWFFWSRRRRWLWWYWRTRTRTMTLVIAMTQMPI